MIFLLVFPSDIGSGYFEPGWSWEKSIKPIAKTDSCQLPHIHYVISGRLKVKLDDGTEEEIDHGDIAYVPPGHNSWVVQIRDAGHGLMYQYPSEFNRAIITFLEDNHEHKELKN